MFGSIVDKNSGNGGGGSVSSDPSTPYANEAAALADGAPAVVVLESPIRGTYYINAAGDGYLPANALDEFDEQNPPQPLNTKASVKVIRNGDNTAGGEQLEIETSTGEFIGD